MKRAIVLFVIVAVFFAFPLTPNDARAGGKWRLYDDFNAVLPGDGFDPAKWKKDEKAGVEIRHDDVNGRAGFVFHDGGERNRSSWLQFIDCPESIVAVKATFITEGSCSNSGARGRIGLHLGTFQGLESWHQMDIQPGDHRLWGAINVKYDPAQDLWYNLFYGEFRDDLDYDNGVYTVEMRFDKKKVVFESGKLGRMTFQLPSALGDRVYLFSGIGLRVNNYGHGDCTFYVDDVYIMRKGSCDRKPPKVKKYTKKGRPDLAYVEVMFNEPMDTGSPININTNGPSDLFGPSWDTQWRNGSKVLRLHVDPVNQPLPRGTYKITLQHGGLRDLKGNLLKEKTFKLKIR